MLGEMSKKHVRMANKAQAEASKVQDCGSSGSSGNAMYQSRGSSSSSSSSGNAMYYVLCTSDVLPHSLSHSPLSLQHGMCLTCTCTCTAHIDRGVYGMSPISLLSEKLPEEELLFGKFTLFAGRKSIQTDTLFHSHHQPTARPCTSLSLSLSLFSLLSLLLFLSLSLLLFLSLSLSLYLFLSFSLPLSLSLSLCLV